MRVTEREETNKGRRKTIPDGNLNLHRRMKSTGNGNYMGRKKEREICQRIPINHVDENEDLFSFHRLKGFFPTTAFTSSHHQQQQLLRALRVSQSAERHSPPAHCNAGRTQSR
ncbi:kita-kyushu lung cancer antigen 1 isoform X1 [Equus asinus]|uniref:kita-kyushu lung cancer antigen 1 isoform X1 n=1 Tax=Equus asinus TaxID=9793 RepID=UPI0038F7ABB1